MKLCLLLSFLSWFFPTPEEKAESAYYKIFKEHVHIVKERYHLRTAVVGENNAVEPGVSKYKILSPSTGYMQRGLKSLEELRFLVLALSQDLILRLNRSPQVALAFKEYPLTIQNIEVQIMVMGDDNQFIRCEEGAEPKDRIEFASLYKGRLLYSTRINDRPYDFLQESYEEALRLARQNHPELVDLSAPQ